MRAWTKHSGQAETIFARGSLLSWTPGLFRQDDEGGQCKTRKVRKPGKDALKGPGAAPPGTADFIKGRVIVVVKAKAEAGHQPATTALQLRRRPSQASSTLPLPAPREKPKAFLAKRRPAKARLKAAASRDAEREGQMPHGTTVVWR